MNMRNAKGFTLIELVIVMAIVAIVTILAVPSMSRVLESNQATQQTHDFVSAIQLSLSEAEKTNTNVTVCAKKAGTDECVNYAVNPDSKIWRNGWLLFSDTASNGIYEASSDTLIKSQVHNTNQINVVSPATAFTVTPGGVVVRGVGNYNFSPTTCTQTNGHKITIYKTGQLLVKGGICP